MTFDFHPRTRLVFGSGASTRLGELARETGFHRTLLVADKGLVPTGQISRASLLLRAGGLSVFPFHDFDSSPDSEMVEAGRAYTAPLAIECSMLGAAHACANPLTARYGTTHGHALAVLLPHVVRWNAAEAADEYADLLRVSGEPHSSDTVAAERLASRLADLAAVGKLPTRVRSLGVPADDLPVLAEQAATQWTGTFNPRAFDASGALETYRSAF